MNLKDIELHGKKVGENNPPCIVAELSANHKGSLSLALDLVDAAKEAGCDAIKLQTYTPDTMTLPIDTGKFAITDPQSLWKGRTLYDLYTEGSLNIEWHEKIFERASKHGLIYFSTPFAPELVDFLEPLHPACYKIASLEIVDFPLIRKCASTKRPLIFSTGASSFIEIAEAIHEAKSAGASDIIILKCTSAYPAPYEGINLKTMAHMKEAFQTNVGLSDHTTGLGAAIGATALGACMIEKHFTLSRKAGGLDAAFSLEPHEMKQLVTEVHNTYKALGTISYASTPEEATSLSHRRSLYFVKNLKKGEKITPDAIRAIRPGGGLHTRYFDIIIGKRTTCDVQEGCEVTWNHLLYE